MENKVLGLHHITAIATSAKRNFDFYTKVLGLRFVKKTVNFDDPKTYHLYYGNEQGAPGTILTFFPWEGTRPDEWVLAWRLKLDIPFQKAVLSFGKTGWLITR